MTPTSDERREVAERLRRLHLGGANKDLIELTLSDAVGAWHENGMSWDYITERLADLIDPTCRAVHQGTSMDDELVCSECGASLGVEVDDEQRFIPKFCSCCGARVVSGDD